MVRSTGSDFYSSRDHGANSLVRTSLVLIDLVHVEQIGVLSPENWSLVCFFHHPLYECRFALIDPLGFSSLFLYFLHFS